VPTEQDLKAFEAVIGFRLPRSFDEVTLSPLGGLYFAVQEELWPRPKHFQIGPADSFAFGIKVFGIADDAPDWLDIRIEYNSSFSQGIEGLVPFLARECEDRPILLRFAGAHLAVGP